MSNKALIKKIERIEFNARCLLEDTAALKEELSGGSDSSISKSILSIEHRDRILKKRHKTAFKKQD